MRCTAGCGFQAEEKTAKNLSKLLIIA